MILFLLFLNLFSWLPSQGPSSGTIRSGGWTLHPDREEFWDQVSFQNNAAQVTAERAVIYKKPEIWQAVGTVRFDFKDPKGMRFKGLAQEARYDKPQEELSAQGDLLDLEILSTTSSPPLKARAERGTWKLDSRNLYLRGRVNLRQAPWESFSKKAHWDATSQKLKLEEGPPLLRIQSPKYEAIFQGDAVFAEGEKKFLIQGKAGAWIHPKKTAKNPWN